jgi:hypothetical protein
MSHDNDMIGPIAAFIGARLQYPTPEINGQGNPWSSTIQVQQHKEKFFYARVYCTLAHPDLVKAKWDWLRANRQAMAHKPVRYCKFPEDMTLADPPANFASQCLLHDAIHYRRVYLDMVALQPQLRGKICSQADCSELLYATYEELLEKELNSASASWAEIFLRRYSVADMDELKGYLQVVYNPTTKVRMELID